MPNSICNRNATDITAWRENIIIFALRSSGRYTHLAPLPGDVVEVGYFEAWKGLQEWTMPGNSCAGSAF